MHRFLPSSAIGAVPAATRHCAVMLGRGVQANDKQSERHYAIATAARLSLATDRWSETAGQHRIIYHLVCCHASFRTQCSGDASVVRDELRVSFELSFAARASVVLPSSGVSSSPWRTTWVAAWTYRDDKIVRTAVVLEKLDLRSRNCTWLCAFVRKTRPKIISTSEQDLSSIIDTFLSQGVI